MGFPQLMDRSAGSPGGSAVKNPSATHCRVGILGRSLGQEDPLEEKMATRSNILSMDRGAWRATVRGITKELDMT